MLNLRNSITGKVTNFMEKFLKQIKNYFTADGCHNETN